MVLAYISIEGWIIHPDVNSFFYGSDEVLVLPPYNAEIFNGGIMTCDVLVVTIENFSIVGREDQNLIRAIKEAIYIRVNNPSLNRNIGKYHLPHIWDEVLNNISELKLK